MLLNFLKWQEKIKKVDAKKKRNWCHEDKKVNGSRKRLQEN